MKKSILSIKALVVMVALVTFSCSNDDDIQCPEALTGELTATETEFAGTWELTAMLAEDAIDITNDETENPSKDVFAQFTECQRDLVYDFKTDRAYSYKQGSVAEDCQNEQSINGSWSLNDELLTFVASCTTQRVNIDLNKEGDAFTFDSVLSFNVAEGGVKTTKVTFTYERVTDGETVTPEGK